MNRLQNISSLLVMFMMGWIGIFAPAEELHVSAQMTRERLIEIKESHDFKMHSQHGFDYYFNWVGQESCVELWVVPRILERDYAEATQSDPQAVLLEYLVDQDGIANEALYQYVSQSLPEGVNLQVFLSLNYDPGVQEDPVRIGPVYQYKGGQETENRYQVFVDQRYPEQALVRQLNEEAKLVNSKDYQYRMTFDGEKFILYLQPSQLPDALQQDETALQDKFLGYDNTLDFTPLVKDLAQRVSNETQGNHPMDYVWVNQLESPSDNKQWLMATYFDGKLVTDYKNRFAQRWDYYYHKEVFPQEIIQAALTDDSLKKGFEAKDLKWTMNYQTDQFDLVIEPKSGLKGLLLPEKQGDLNKYLALENDFSHPDEYDALMNYISDRYKEKINLNIYLGHTESLSDNQVLLYGFKQNKIEQNQVLARQIDYHVQDVNSQLKESYKNDPRGLDLELTYEDGEFVLLYSDKDMRNDFSGKDLLAYEHYVQKRDYLSEFKPLMENLSKDLNNRLGRTRLLNLRVNAPRMFNGYEQYPDHYLYTYEEGVEVDNHLDIIQSNLDNRLNIVLQELNGNTRILSSIVTTYLAGKEMPEFVADEQSKTIYLVIREHNGFRRDGLGQEIADLVHAGLVVSPESFYDEKVQIINDSLLGEYTFVK